tara:strand:- start:335 stop:664 length:330 start_codon:yes stop_codon:yes gene_type:complete
MLQIRIDQDHCTAATISKIKGSQHGSLLAEIAGEFEQGHARSRMSTLPRPDLGHRGITGAIINQQKMIHIGLNQHPLNELGITRDSLKHAATTQSCSLAITSLEVQKKP